MGIILARSNSGYQQSQDNCTLMVLYSFYAPKACAFMVLLVLLACHYVWDGRLCPRGGGGRFD